MGKEYKYRKHIVWLQFIWPIFIVFYGIFQTLILALISKNSIIQMMVFDLFSLMLAIFIQYLFYSMARIRVSIGEDAILYSARRGETKIQFGDIVKLKFPYLSYTGGWIKIISPSSVIRLTVVLEDIGEFLQELKVSLDHKNVSYCYDRKKFFCFFKTATYADHSWARLYSFFWKFIQILFIIVTTGAFCGIFLTYHGHSVQEIFWWIVSSFIWPFIVWFITEAIFGRQIAKKSDEESFTCPPRDKTYERFILRKAVLFGGLIYFLVCAIILFFLV